MRLTRRGIAVALNSLLLTLAGALLLAAPAGASQVYVTGSTGDAISPFAIGSGGGLTPISCGASCNTASQPIGAAISPDGQYLYAANHGSSRVTPFSIGANGSLTPISCGANCNTGVQPQAIAVSPSGNFLYVANRGTARVSVYSIAANGTLTPVTCTTNCNTGAAPMWMAISPDGQRLYTVNRTSATVSAFSVNANGTLTPISCGTNCNTGPTPGGIAVSADGRYVYASNFANNTVSPYSINANGSLTPISCPGSNCNTAAGPDFQSVVTSPVQPPTAAFTATPAPPGQVTSFDASASAAAPGQTVARYDWEFGDGQVALDAGPTPTHVYAAEDNYTARVTVTDDAGCSTALTYTGQTASCNGSAVATVTHTVSVGDPPQAVIDSPRHRVFDTATPTFTFHATELGSTFECSIDTGAPDFGPCSGPGASHTPAAPLAIGLYAFRVRATDPLGFTGLPDTEMFRIDTAREPQRCPAVRASLAGKHRPRGLRRAAQGRRVTGVRARIEVDRPARLAITARVRWRDRQGRRSARLGRDLLANPRAATLRMAIPGSLADELPRGKAVTLKLRVAAYPESAPGCVDPRVERLSLRTRVTALKRAS